MTVPFWVLATLLKGTVLLLGASVVAALLRGASASLRHLVWGLGIVTVLVLPLVSLALPWQLAIVPLETAVVPAAAHQETPTSTLGVPSAPQRPVEHEATGGPNVAGTAAGSPPPQSGEQHAAISPTTIITLLLVIWGIGAVVLLARLAVGAFVLARVVRRGTPLESPDWRHPLLEAADRLALPEPPRLVMSDRFPMPFACGVLHPAIVVPSGAADWDDRRRRTVLVHELAHLARRDLLVNALGQAACAIYWFHPLVWMAARKLRIESERACDDLVLGVGTRPSEYADHLLQIVCRASRSRTPAVALPMAQRHEFEGRMLAILERVARREPASGRHAAVLGVLALTLMVPLAALAPVRDAPSLPAEPSSTKPPSASLSPTRTATRSPTASPTPRPARLVARVDTAGVVAALVRALEDSVASVREDAAYALGQLSATAAVVPLAARLGRDPAAKVREMIAWALGQIESRSSTPALGAAAQQDSSEDVRAMAVWALAQVGDPASVPTLAGLLRDRSPEVRGRAAWAIGSMESTGAPAALIATLADPSPDVRLKAAWALGQIADPSAVSRLGAALHDSSTEVRRAAMWALGQIGGEPAQSALLQALQDPDPEVRARAARALGGSHGDPWPWPWPMPIIR